MKFCYYIFLYKNPSSQNPLNFSCIFSIERQANIKIFLSACKELKARTNLKTEVIERLEVGDWMEMLQTLQSLSKKMYEKLKDTSANFDPFTLKDRRLA